METASIKMYTLKEAARAMRISYGVLWDMCQKNEIEYYRVRSKYIISEKQIQDYFAAQGEKQDPK